jgi:hypothetical protein
LNHNLNNNNNTFDNNINNPNLKYSSNNKNNIKSNKNPEDNKPLLTQQSNPNYTSRNSNSKDNINQLGPVWHDDEYNDSFTSGSPIKKSVIFIDREGADEWAALVKFDSELYKLEEERKRNVQNEKKKQIF